MMAVRSKPYSTKAWAKMIPAPDVAHEFEQFFITGGWAKVNRMYGKRCANRWYIMLGAERLKAARARFVRGEADG
jgi:hypothetical protein